MMMSNAPRRTTRRLPAFLGLALVAGCAVMAPAQARVEPREADRIVAVVNDEVITQRELESRLNSALGQLKRQGTPLPPMDVLQKQMLERMITDRVQLQTAKDMGMRIDDNQLDQTIGRIAAANKLGVAQFREALEKDGVQYPRFREEIRQEILIARLKDREVDNKIAVSEGEIDNYLSGDTQGGAASEEVQLQHILVRVPEGASPDALQRLKAKADQVQDRASKGEDFSQLAAAYSDAADGLSGGDLGFRTPDRLPALYADAAARLKAGEISPVLRSPAGFHIIKLANKRGSAAQLPPVEQIHARHILIKVSEVVSEAEARRKLENLKERLDNGGDFAELARLYSQDGSAAKGGDLGWLYPGDTVPEFEKAMMAMKVGETSGVVQSPFGFHLIQVLERRVQDVSQDRQRAAARQAIRERRSEEAYQDWLRQLRDRAYIEIRLEDR